MMVAGTVRNGIFDALAYKNFTTGVTVHQSIFLWFVVGVVFSSMGIGVLIKVLPEARGIAAAVVITLMAGGFLLFGGIGLYAGRRTLQAVNALRVAR